MSEQKRDRREYYRQYYRKNRERLLKNHKDWMKENRPWETDEGKQKKHEYYLAHREHITEHFRERYRNDPDLRERCRQKNKKYHNAHREQINARLRERRRERKNGNG